MYNTALTFNTLGEGDRFLTWMMRGMSFANNALSSTHLVIARSCWICRTCSLIIFVCLLYHAHLIYHKSFELVTLYGQLGCLTLIYQHSTLFWIFTTIVIKCNKYILTVIGIYVRIYVREEPAVSYRWTGWIWELTSWSLRLQEDCRSF